MHRTLHNKAKDLRPKDQPSKPTTIWVGVLNDSKKPEDALAEADFLWLKCHKVMSTRAASASHVLLTGSLIYNCC